MIGRRQDRLPHWDDASVLSLVGQAILSPAIRDPAGCWRQTTRLSPPSRAGLASGGKARASPRRKPGDFHELSQTNQTKGLAGIPFGVAAHSAKRTQFSAG